MGLFGRGRDRDQGVRCEAVVIAVRDRNAEGPLTLGTVHLQVQPPNGPAFQATDSGMIRASKKPRPGMTVPVKVKSDGGVEIVWDEVPTWEERVERGDPAALEGDRDRAAALHAAHGATLDTLMPEMAPHFQRVRAQVADARTDDANAAATPPAAAAAARPGWVRGTAQVVNAPEAGNPARVQEVVLRIEIPGREPYAVQRRMRLQRIDLTGAGYPVLVSADDPKEIEFLWDEVPDSGTQLAGRIQQGLAQSDQGFAALQEQQMAQGAQFAQDYAEQTLAQITDPQQREAFINAMRAAGWKV